VYDKERYQSFLAFLKKGWNHFMSSLETDIIEDKLTMILNSLTFRYTRKPEFLKLIPERI
jgi:hypothetical protein